MGFFFFFAVVLYCGECWGHEWRCPTCNRLTLLPGKKCLVDTKPKYWDLHWTLTSDFTPSWGLLKRPKKKKRSFHGCKWGVSFQNITVFHCRFFICYQFVSHKKSFNQEWRVCVTFHKGSDFGMKLHQIWASVVHPVSCCLFYTDNVLSWGMVTTGTLLWIENQHERME